MTTRMNLIFTLFLAIFCSCEKVTTSPDRPQHGNEIGPDEKQLAFIDELYQSQNRITIESLALNKLIMQLENRSLIEKETVSEIPKLFLSFLENEDKDFSMADPGEYWQEQVRLGCGSPIVWHDNQDKEDKPQKPIPTSQLIYFGLYEDIALLAYYTGGIRKSETIVLFKYSDTKITEHWKGTTLDYATNKETILASIKEIGERNSSFVPEHTWCSY